MNDKNFEVLKKLEMLIKIIVKYTLKFWLAIILRNIVTFLTLKIFYHLSIIRVRLWQEIKREKAFFSYFLNSIDHEEKPNTKKILINEIFASPQHLQKFKFSMNTCAYKYEVWLWPMHLPCSFSLIFLCH